MLNWLKKKISSVAGTESDKRDGNVPRKETMLPNVAVNDQSEIYRKQGNECLHKGDLEGAEKNYRNAVLIRDNNVGANVNLGFVLKERGEFKDALFYLQKALVIDPSLPDVYYMLGNIAQSQDQIEEAIGHYRNVLSFHETHFEANFCLGSLLTEKKYFDEAKSCYKTALISKPDCAEAYNLLGNLYFEEGDLELAQEYMNKAIALAPTNADARQNLGSVLHRKGALKEARENYERALELNPDSFGTYYNLGCVLWQIGEHEKAIASHRKALSLKPDFHVARTDLMRMLYAMCDWSIAKEDVELLRKSVRENMSGGMVPPFMFFTLPGTTPAEQRLCAEQWVRRECEPLLLMREKLAFEFKRDISRKIRIGYLSADFYLHATALLMAEIFELHDRSRFQVVAYSYSKDDGSPMRRRLENAFDDFVEISHFSNEQAAKKIFNDEIDILVDLKGHTADSRSAILALRPAPIQVNFLGYPGTMGAEFVDYILADRFTIPPELQEHYTEKVSYLPDCYQPNDRTRESAAIPSRVDCGLPDGAVVFCCFNHTYKITPDIFDIWCNLLEAVPDSVLWLLASNSASEKNLRRELQKRGIDDARLVMAPQLPPAEHLARLQHADLFLDTQPVNAHTTCSDALWMGVPVITISGTSFPSRVAGSLLTALNVPELITYTLKDYYSVALDLARNHEKRFTLRRKILANRDSSPLFDSQKFTNNLEGIYLEMWKQYQLACGSDVESGARL